MYQREIDVANRGRGTTDVTARIAEIVRASGVQTGLCHAFCRHTSASLIICENADPTVREDLERFAARWVPDGDALFAHDAEGPDDMPAHVRSVFTQSGLTLPVSGGRLALGTWQGVYLWEHRHQPHTRHIVITVSGD